MSAAVCRHDDGVATGGPVVCLRKGHCLRPEPTGSEPSDTNHGHVGGAHAKGACGDNGMSTVEYAIGTVVAAAFAAVLYRIVTGDSVVAGLTDLINSALSTSF